MFYHYSKRSCNSTPHKYLLDRGSIARSGFFLNRWLSSMRFLKSVDECKQNMFVLTLPGNKITANLFSLGLSICVRTHILQTACDHISTVILRVFVFVPLSVMFYDAKAPKFFKENNNMRREKAGSWWLEGSEAGCCLTQAEADIHWRLSLAKTQHHSSSHNPHPAWLVWRGNLQVRSYEVGAVSATPDQIQILPRDEEWQTYLALLPVQFYFISGITSISPPLPPRGK